MRTPRRPKFSDIPALVLIVTSVAGLVLAARPREVRELLAPQAGRAVSRQAVLTGEFAGEVDRAIERYHPFREIAVALVAPIRLILFRQGNPGVIVGSEGWLFTREEFEHHESDEAALQTRLGFIAATADRLAVKGIDLHVVLIPSKARLALEYVPAARRPLVDHARLQRARTALSRRGVSFSDGAVTLTAEHFFARDTHWRPAGARVIADAVARDIRRNTVGSGNEARSRLWKAEFELTAGRQALLTGDLVAFVPVKPFDNFFGITPERYHPLSARRVDGNSAGLFDDPSLPVTLVGTSYSEDARFGFADALRHSLGAEVLNVASRGDGPFAPMSDYLSSTTFTELPPELIVWEIPERYLTLPDTPE